jgi:hypothetical protein
MSCEKGQTTIIPCEPFEARCYDINQDRTINVRVIGYRVAIRELSDESLKGFLKPITLASGDKHGVIAVPEWESLEPNPLTQVSASPANG